MKYLVSLFITLMTFNAIAQKGFTNKAKAKNKYKDSLKVGKWIEYRDSAWKNTDVSTAKYYHLVNYKKGIPVGTGRDYYLNGQLQNDYSYVGGLKSGPSKWYYPSGKLKGVGSFKDNELEGKAIWYFESGNLMEENFYISGKKNGPDIWYFENGKKETEINYTNGEKQGIQKWYYQESGRLYCDVNYTAGKKNGIQRWYNDENGAVVGESVFENGEKNGKDFTLYNNGKLRSECNYVKGKAEGLDKFYYESGALKEEAKYENGKREGKFVTYWEQGQIKREDIYRDNKWVSGKTYNKDGKELPYYAYEIMPEFPGGVPELTKFLKGEVVYPEKSKKAGISGRVLVKFVVDVDGSITDVTIVNSVNKELDEEAIRVVYKMPKWKPGSRDGEGVKTYYHLPIRFKL